MVLFPEKFEMVRAVIAKRGWSLGKATLFEKGEKPRTITCEGGDGYIGELSHMIESINNKRQPSIVTARDGQSAVEICEAEEKSIKTGALVRLQ